MIDDGKTGHIEARPTLRNRHSAAVVELSRYRLLVENILDYAIFMMDAEGYIQTWNKGAEKNKGYKPDEIIGKHFSIFYRQSDIDAKKPERELEIATQFGRVEDEDWRLRKDGSRFWANVVITALYDDDGELVGFAKVTRDLTERKLQEDTVREAYNLLKRQQRELDGLNTSKDEFISLASHQLRTPATGIKQYLGMLLEGFMGELTAEQLRCVKMAYDNNEHQIAIVNNLLKVAQIDAGKVVLRKAPTDISKLVSEVVEEHRDTMAKRQQTIMLDLPPPPFTVVIDPAHFRMALENLVDNASKYTPAKGKIKVSASMANGNLKVSIQDSGVGVAEEDIPRLFEKFTRISNQLSETVGGSGLGLYWVDRVIALHNGRVEVSSVVNKGTTFDIYVPGDREDA